MVSRQETARPLLTPGEVMQLPPTDELLLVAGVPPIRARKARFYEDTRFKERILPPPDLAAQPNATVSSSDDWSAQVLAASLETTAAGHGGGDGDPANAGIRREPELPEHEEIVPPTASNYRRRHAERGVVSRALLCLQGAGRIGHQ